MRYEAGWCNKTWAIKAKEAAPNEVRDPLNTNPVFHCHGGKNMFQKSDHCHPVMLQAWKNPYVELYHNRTKIAHLPPPLPPIFFVNFTSVIHIYLLRLIMIQSLKQILRVNPDIQASIILGHSWAKIAHMAQRRYSWRRGNFTAVIFIFLLCPIMLQNLKKKFLEQILR